MKYIKKENFNIKYDVDKEFFNIRVINNTDGKHYITKKHLSEYVKYIGFNPNIFNIFINSLENGFFDIWEELNIVYIKILYHNIIFDCKYISENIQETNLLNKSNPAEKSNLEDKLEKKITMFDQITKYKEELYKVTEDLNKIRTEFEKQKELLDKLIFYIEKNDKFIFVNKQRINKYKKHLIIISKFDKRVTNILNQLKIKNVPYYDTDNDFYINNVKQLKKFKNYHDEDNLELPYIIIPYKNTDQLINIIDLKKIIDMKNRIFTMANIEILNFDLIIKFDIEELHIINSDIKDINTGQFLNIIEKITKLKKLVIVGMKSRFSDLKFRKDFFEKLPLLEYFMIDKNIDVDCRTSTELIYTDVYLQKILDKRFYKKL